MKLEFELPPLSEYDPVRTEIMLGINQLHALLAEGPAAFALALQQGVSPSLAQAIRDRVFFGPTRRERITTVEPVRATYQRSTVDNPGPVGMALLDMILVRLGDIPVRANALRALQDAGIAHGTARFLWSEWMELVRGDVPGYLQRVLRGLQHPVPEYDSNTVQSTKAIKYRKKERKVFGFKPDLASVLAAETPRGRTPAELAAEQPRQSTPFDKAIELRSAN